MNPLEKNPFSSSKSTSSGSESDAPPPPPPPPNTTAFVSDPGFADFSPLFIDPPSPLINFESFPSSSSQYMYQGIPIEPVAGDTEPAVGDTKTAAHESEPVAGESEPAAGETELVAVQPLEHLYGTPVPPFLTKIYNLVDDSSLDSIISWGSTGSSFVVWDIVEFSREILPKNFKHSNFSSFVRQLNTYGFRKINADQWEFANEGFVKGKRHLLNNIQRRKSSQYHEAGSSSGSSAEAKKATLEGQIVKLRKEKSLMMQEVVELQQQHRGMVQHMGAVNEKLQAAEQRQKQMVSFLAKVFQNPTFLARLQQMKAQGSITGPRTTRKFVKHQLHDPSRAESSREGEIVKYRSDFQDLTTSFINPRFNAVADQQLLSTGLGAESIPFQAGIVASEELAIAHELVKNPDQAGEGASSSIPKDPHSTGKNLASSQLEAMPEYFVSFPEELAKEKTVLQFPLPGIESMVKDEWSAGFEASAGISNTSNELWSSQSIYDVPELGVSTSFSDVWDIGPLQAVGCPGVENLPDDESPFSDLDPCWPAKKDP